MLLLILQDFISHFITILPMNYKELVKVFNELAYENTAYLKRSKVRSEDRYPYIPTPIHFLQILVQDVLNTVPQIEEKSFLDAGAGTDIIPNMMKILGFKEAKGLEYEEVYVRLASTLFQGDILSYNFYMWDVIYSYNPLVKNKMMQQGLAQIINTMKPGAIFYFVSLDKCRYLIDQGATPISEGYLYKYIKPQLP